MKPGIYLLISFLLIALHLSGQRYIGIATSDWTAINSLYLNPANIADCHEKASINILSLSALVDNNLGHIPNLPDMGSAISSSLNLFNKSGGKNFSMLAPAAVFRGPGVVATLSKNISIALTTDIRAINQFNNFDPALYNTLSLAGNDPPPTYRAKAQNFNWTAHLWSEVGLTFGAVVMQTERSRMNFGLTLRRLGGIGYISLMGRNIDISYKNSADSFYATNTDIQFGSNMVDTNVAFRNLTPGGLFNKFFGETAGSGMSADFGFTYRYRFGEAELSDYDESNATHDIVLSAAITDFGQIHYYNSKSANIRITGNGYLTGQGIDANVKTVADLANYASQHEFEVDTENKDRLVYLPVAFVGGADVQVYCRFYTNILVVANLANRMNFGNSYYGQVTVTPRYDFHKITIAMPVTYSMLAGDLKIGLGFRYMGLFLGSDDMLAAFSKCDYGFNAYFGGYIPLFKRNNDPIGLHWK